MGAIAVHVLGLLVAPVALGLKYGGVTIPKQNNKSFFLGQRLDLNEAEDKKKFQSEFDGRLPCVCLNAFGGLDNDQWTEAMVEKLGSTMIEYDSRDYSDDGTGVSLDTFECTLSEYLNELDTGSDHFYSMYFISEDIMQLEEARQLSSSLQLVEDVFGYDIFQHFPESIRPEKALIIGGVGSRSFLHADPYEWTGWNYCFEGAKLWTFFPPETDSEDGGKFFKTRRSQTTAWGEYNIAAGWQSDIDLYHRVLAADDKDGATSPLNKHWEAVYAAGVASGEKVFRPPRFASSDPILEAVEDLWPLDAENVDIDGSEEDEMPSLVNGAVQIVQQPGELVVIPPGWLHQVYSLTPSVAVSGQYFNQNNKEKVVRHTIDWCNLIGKEEEEARLKEREQNKKKRRRRESKGEFASGGEDEDADGDGLLGEFYGGGGEKEENETEAVAEEVALVGDVHVPPGLLTQSEPSELVPELIRLALLARYRREGVAKEVFEEIYLDSDE